MQFRLVGIYSKNRYEWVIAEQACNAYNMISVPLYDTLGADAVAFVIGQTKMVTVFVEKSATPMVLRVLPAAVKPLAGMLCLMLVIIVVCVAAAEGEEQFGGAVCHASEHRPV
jgi:long-subunit acyl-CoA synthetase (AMP-forming)